MGEVDSFFQIKHICCCDFETHHLADCLLEAWRVSLDFFPEVQLTIHKTTSPVSALLLYSRIFSSFHGAIKKSFQFHGEQGLQEELPHRVRKNET